MFIKHEANPETQSFLRMPSTGKHAFGHPVVALMTVCGLSGLVGWGLYSYALRGQIGEDGMVFHTAGRAWIEGHVDRIYDGAWITEQINIRFAGWLTKPISLHPWVYPPSFLLLWLPLGYLPFGVAFLMFQAASFAAISVAACSRVSSRGLMFVSLILSPATAVNVLLGQNAFLTGALLIGGVGLLRRSPLPAGVLLGLLSYKPQFFLMVPVVLIAGRHWRAAMVTVLTAAALVLSSAAWFGTDIWQSWVETLAGGSGLYQDWVAEARVNGTSVYACAAFLGASPLIANAAQGVAVMLAAASVYYACSRVIRDDLRMATVLAAVFLAAPHSANYDAVLLAIAATLPLLAASEERLSAGEASLLAAVWLCPLFNPPALFAVGVFTPILVLAFIAILLRRGGTQGSGEFLGVRPGDTSVRHGG